MQPGVTPPGHLHSSARPRAQRTAALAVADAGPRIGQVVEAVRDDVHCLALALDAPYNRSMPAVRITRFPGVAPP